ncbi:Uroporphyrinogen-III synthase [hydrothermal vent metagenome]|uniref:uroporphyrinogen-III synthase n=1 Tax=hydrothermal vent metagenome TaxID=652676 RepID=A0A3B1DWX8_9ZZZZ
MANKYNHLPLSNDIANLSLKDIENNLFNYTYHSRYLSKLLNKNFDKEDPHYISTYSSFIGEVYENIIYELLIRYAVKESYITKFVLKGPHQNGYTNDKNGLLIDIKNQIVYKSGYKDVSEFDGLFFGDNNKELWFVESTIVKATTSLKKRLKKKKALLQLVFPELTIRSLIILSNGVIGAKSFPSYCTVWVTKQFDNHKLISQLIDIKKQPKRAFTAITHSKLVEAKQIKINQFKYFETLSWILKKTREDKKNIIDFSFLNSIKIEQYFDIFSKFYIGYMELNEFKELYNFDLENIDGNKIVVTIEKEKHGFVLFYYAKVVEGKLKKIELIENNELKISDKDYKGFSASEVKFMKYIWKPYHKLLSKDIRSINQLIDENYRDRAIEAKQIQREIYLLSDKKFTGVKNLPTFVINFLQPLVDISHYDALIFTSKTGVISMEYMDSKWKEIPSYAISYNTAKMIKSSGGNVEYIGKNGHGNHFAQEIVPLLENKKVLYIRPKTVVSKLIDILNENNINCDELVTYETICKKYKKDDKPPKNSIIILSSPSTLNCFLDLFGWDDSYVAVSIGKTTLKFIPNYINVKVSEYTSISSCIKLAKSL